MTYNTGAEANQERRRHSQDLINSKFAEGMLNGPVDMDRRLRCTESFKEFCETYGQEAFTLDWSPYHLEALDKISEVVKVSSSYALAMPRGSGKSTLCHWSLIWGLLCGHSNYMIYVGATSSASQTRLNSIKTTLRFNDLLLEDFPEILGPIRYCEGEARKAGGQKWNKEPTEIRWGSDKLLFPTLSGFAENVKWYKDVPDNFGAVLDFASLEGNLRGRAVELPSGQVLRPQVAIVDDPQTRESAASPAQVTKREQILKGDIGYLGGPERQCGVAVPCTVVYEDDLAHRLLDHTLNPEFRGTRSAMLPQLPGHGLTDDEAVEVMKLWEVDYEEKRRYDLINGTAHSTDFYRDNQEAMDKGALASWPQRFSESKNEISAVQSAMNLYLADEMSFMCEAQNEPMPLEDRDQEPLTTKDIMARGINIDRLIAPQNAQDVLTAFIDISRNVLWYTVMSWNKETYKGHIVDYGIWPDQNRPYATLASCKKTIPELYPNDEYSVALTKALSECVGHLMNQEYMTENGETRLYLDKLGIDSGWGQEAQTVYTFCKRSELGRLIISTKGFGSTPAKRPLVDPEKKREPRTSLVGQWKFTRNTVGSQLLQYDTNQWKSKVDNMFRLPAFGSTGTTLYDKKVKNRAPNHRMIAEQVTAERPMWLEGGGRRIEIWKSMPGKDNHLLDCVVGCAMLANVCGCEIQTTKTVISAVTGDNIKVTREKRRKRKFKLE